MLTNLIVVIILQCIYIHSVYYIHICNICIYIHNISNYHIVSLNLHNAMHQLDFNGAEKVK